MPRLNYRVPPDVQARFRELLGRDRDENLAARFQFYSEQDPEMTEDLLGAVPLIGQYGWAFIPIEPEGPGDERFGFSIGFHYRFGVPEVLILSPSLDQKAMHLTIQRIGSWVRRGNRIEPGMDYGPALGLESLVLEEPTPEFLERHPYGYGWAFYEHFMDTDDIPLLVARPARAPGEHPAVVLPEPTAVLDGVASIGLPEGAVPLRNVALGTVHLPSGMVVVCDPFTCDDWRPLDVTIPPGTHRVFGSVAEFPGGRQALAYVGLRWGEGGVVRWELAQTVDPSADEDDDADPNAPVRVDLASGATWFGSDSGLAALVDETAYRRLVASDARLEELERKVGQRRRDAWGVGDCVVNPRTGANALAFTTGWGRGAYSTWVGCDAAGRPAALIVDLNLAELPSEDEPSPGSEAGANEGDPELLRLLAEGRRTEAVRLVSEATGIGLAEAKATVEAFEQIHSPALVAATPALGRAQDPDLSSEIGRLLQAGRKIEAICLFRRRTGLGLEEAKRAVEELAGHESPATRSGCLGLLLAWFLPA